MSIHVAVQSTRRVLRDVFAAYFASRPDFTVVGRVSECDDLALLCELRSPQVVLYDAGPRFADAVEAHSALRSRFPHLRAVILYNRASPEQVAAAARVGGMTMVPYSRGLDTLIALLREWSAISPGDPGDRVDLTDRELAILVLMGSGHSVREMAALLDVSPHVVENDKRRINTKLEANSAVHAVSRAASLGIVTGTLPNAAPREELASPVASPGTTPAGRASTSAGTVLAVVCGTIGATLDRVALILVAHGLPFVLERAPGRLDRAVEDQGRAGFAYAHRGPVAVVLVDPTPPDWQVPSALGAATVLVHSEPLNPAATALALGPRAHAVLPAERVSDHLVPVLMLVACGYLVAEAGSVHPFLTAANGADGHQPAGLPELSGRETDILRCIAVGHTVRQTARSLGIAVKTVEATQTRLFRKLGVRNRSGALVVAHSLGML